MKKYQIIIQVRNEKTPCWWGDFTRDDFSSVGATALALQALELKYEGDSFRARVEDWSEECPFEPDYYVYPDGSMTTQNGEAIPAA